MKILANRKIKFLFCSILSCILVFVLISTVLVNLDVRNTVYYIIFCSVCMGAAILLFCYGYFKEQHKIMENAISQITEYISGNKEVTIECNDEGELYRLFHEVNSLVAILNAHAENEKSAKKFLRNTISDISHQLKTPLAALNIYNGIIQGEAKELPTIQEFSQLSEQELDRIETLVQSLLKITKLDAGTIILEKSLENVSELAKNIKKHFLFRAEQEGKEICLSGNEEIKLLCDRNWIIEAISNLVKNALDHTEKGGLIRIEWRAFTSIVQISVKDNGSGIHPDDLYHIFKRFYRSRFSKDTQGIGLGLSLTKAIVEVSKIRNLSSDYVFADNRAENSDVNGSYWVFRLAAYGFLAIISFITILNIMNSISMSVSARIKQYGAMRAVGMGNRQITKMITAEAITYAACGTIIGFVLGLLLHYLIYVKIIVTHFGGTWKVPVVPMEIIVLLVLVSCILAVYAPAKRIRNMAITATINEL